MLAVLFQQYFSSWILKILLQNLGFEEVGLIPMADGMVQCSTCGKTLSTMQSARRHYNLIHAKDTIDMATCPICQKQFSGKSYVDDHMRKTHKISKKMWKKSCGNLSQILENLFHSCIPTLSKQMKYRIQFYLGCRFFEESPYFILFFLLEKNRESCRF